MGCMTLRQKCCLSKAVPCPYPNSNPDEIWSKGIFRVLSFFRMYVRIMQTELKMVIVVVDEKQLDEVSCHEMSQTVTRDYTVQFLQTGLLYP